MEVSGLVLEKSLAYKSARKSVTYLYIVSLTAFIFYLASQKSNNADFSCANKKQKTIIAQHICLLIWIDHTFVY